MARGKTAESSLYSVHPGVAYVQAIVENLQTNTGKTLDNWLLLVKKAKLAGVKECKDWLLTQHKLGGSTAGLIAEGAFGESTFDTDPKVYLASAAKWVEDLYAGPKSALRPIHDALIELGRSFGEDVKICPCKTIVPLYRNHVFAQIKPSTRTRIDFGLALKGAAKKPTPRLIATGGLEKGDRITHRITIGSLEEIDAEVKIWARIAYNLDGG